jgi:hypothetical protein
MSTFSDILSAAGSLSADEQETLVEILGRRIAERKRDQLVRDVKEGRAEFADGRTRATSVSDIMDEASGAS